jgi:hypothetical protein
MRGLVQGHTLVAAVAALAVGLGLAPSASAAEVGRILTFGYKPDPEVFAGKVRRTQGGPEGCFAHVKVVVFRKQAGEAHRIGTDRTNARHRYKVPYPFHRGRYFAFTPEKTVGDDTCLAIKTPLLRLE